MSFSLEYSKNQLPILKFQNRYLHSPYNPLKEAQKISKTIQPHPQYCLIVLGLALAYHINPFLQKQNPIHNIIVIDQSPQTLLPLLKKTPQSSVLESIQLFPGPAQQLENWLHLNMPEYQSYSTKILEHSPSIQLNPKYYQKIKSSIQKVLTHKLQSYLTTLAFSQRWHENTLKNLAHSHKFLTPIPNSIPKTNIPVLIIGSGPTLNQYLPTLRQIQNKTILIALAPTYTTLLQNHIFPHFVVSIDPGIANRIHCPTPSTKSSHPTVLATTLSSNPHFLRLWNQYCLILNHELPLENFLLSQSNYQSPNQFPKIPSQGTVTLTAFYLAQMLSSSHIILIGLDFSFVHGLYHFQGNALEQHMFFKTLRILPTTSQLFHLKHQFQLVQIPNQPHPSQSNIAMQSYKNWLEIAILHSQHTVYSLNHPAPHIQYTSTIDLKTFASSLPIQNFHPLSILQNIKPSQLAPIQIKLSSLLANYQKLLQTLPKYPHIPHNHQQYLIQLLQNPPHIQTHFSQIFLFSQSRFFKKKNIQPSDWNHLIQSIQRSIQLIQKILPSFPHPSI